jgi:hypothetical protein
MTRVTGTWSIGVDDAALVDGTPLAAAAGVDGFTPLDEVLGPVPEQAATTKVAIMPSVDSLRAARPGKQAIRADNRRLISSSSVEIRDRVR